MGENSYFQRVIGLEGGIWALGGQLPPEKARLGTTEKLLYMGLEFLGFKIVAIRIEEALLYDKQPSDY